ncbi:helix-turn-helix domain-containing protein [Lactococcus petauri]|uniref:helix-turn-helix domain-containing protein n=1 Tax=Lactococcus petauri TaxID=1940789 RepID=UPI001F05A8B1|nr:helix-turn-helix transcriptional regulator [Lactococcus petauri]MCH1712934.1 helix-turn-helix domain-containing protein [Lactococcus petauri]
MTKNRIKELREEQNETLIGLMRRVNAILNENNVTVNDKPLTITDSQLSFYENGKRSPRNEEIWGALSKVFHVSVPYLKGDSDFKDTEAIVNKQRMKSMNHLLHGIQIPDSAPNLVELEIIEDFGEKTLSRIKENYKQKNSSEKFLNLEYEKFLRALSLVDKDLYNLMVLYSATDSKKRKIIYDLIMNILEL